MVPRLSAKVVFENNDFAIKRISPDKLVEFLDDILKSFGIKERGDIPPPIN